MKFIKVHEARANMSKVIEDSQETTQVILNHGRPVAILTGCDGKTIEDITAEFAAKKKK